MKMITLDQMGKRICIIGCSNSGKSTLADALSKKLNIPAHHLDQYAHIENSNWQRTPDEILIETHNNIIKQDAWIIDGNTHNVDLLYGKAVSYIDLARFNAV